MEIASQADTSVVLLAPGMGDGIQAAKAGILEIGDVYVVNKADRDGADATARELNHMLGLGESRGPGDWRPPIVKTVAARGEGVDEVVEALEKHRAWMEEHGVLAERRAKRAAHEVETIAVGRCGSGSATCGATGGWGRWRSGSWRGSWILTRRRTSWWRGLPRRRRFGRGARCAPRTGARGRAAPGAAFGTA